MSDYIALPTGGVPWQPTEDSRLVELFHEFTIPLVGVVEQGGVKYLFWCVVGHAYSEQAWAYAMVKEASLSELRDATADTFDDILRAAVDGQTTVFAIASDEKGISVSVTLDPPACFDTVYSRGMEQLNEKIAQARDEYETLAAQFPLMRPPSIVPTPRVSAPA